MPCVHLKRLKSARMSMCRTEFELPFQRRQIQRRTVVSASSSTAGAAACARLVKMTPSPSTTANAAPASGCRVLFMVVAFSADRFRCFRSIRFSSAGKRLNSGSPSSPQLLPAALTQSPEAPDGAIQPQIRHAGSVRGRVGTSHWPAAKCEVRYAGSVRGLARSNTGECKNRKF